MKYLTETVYSVVSHEYDVLRGRYNACYLWEEPTDASSRLLGMRYYPFTDEDYSTSNPDWNSGELEAQGHNKAYHFHWDTNKNITHVTDGGWFKFTGAMFQLLHSILFGLLYI